ncbi:hypothetical protein [Niallia sp. FSL R7-0271]|uniref:hypothetical protein n=1 Tax=Niallia sp. FSL R7-0271 TaxID=2921678 RepID=UPI0030FB77E3
MEEKELRSAKMHFNHKVNMEKFKRETFEKLDQSKQKKLEVKRKKKYPMWMMAVAASIIIIGTAINFGGTYIADAAETLINQLFGSKEQFEEAYPNESSEEIDIFEQTLAIAKENLTEEEFNQYTQLLKEQTEIFTKVEKEDREYPNEEEEKKLDKIQASMRTYENKIIPIQAKQLASFDFIHPTFIPEGYKQVGENYDLDNLKEEPVFSIEYSNGKSDFWIQQIKIGQKVDMESKEACFFEKSESYSLNGYHFDYVPSKVDWPLNGMRVSFPEEGYKVIVLAHDLSKEELEKVSLSMIEK